MSARRVSEPETRVPCLANAGLAGRVAGWGDDRAGKFQESPQFSGCSSDGSSRKKSKQIDAVAQPEANRLRRLRDVA